MEESNIVNLDDELLLSMELKARKDAESAREYAERCLSSNEANLPYVQARYIFWREHELNRLKDAELFAKALSIGN